MRRLEGAQRASIDDMRCAREESPAWQLRRAPSGGVVHAGGVDVAQRLRDAMVRTLLVPLGGERQSRCLPDLGSERLRSAELS
jgi:hypothetical protein